MEIVCNMDSITEEFLPCDLTSFDAVWPHILDDPVLQCIVALTKEPKPSDLLASFVEERRIPREGRNGSFYAGLCQHMCKAMSTVKTKAVWKNLNQQGNQRGKSPTTPTPP